MRAAAALLALLATPAGAADVRVYTGEPLAVALPVGQERRVEIEGARDIRVGLPGALRGQLEVESAGPNVWFRARRALPPTRLYLASGARLFALEVRADESAPRQPLRLRAAAAGPAQEGVGAAPSYVALARYAIQALYAPEHRPAQVPGIRSRPVADRPVALFRCRAAAPAACGDATEARPLAAWEAAPYFVTALEVRNFLAAPLELDPRDIRGEFAAAAIVHPRLAPAGDPHDATAVVLISALPFAGAEP